MWSTQNPGLQNEAWMRPAVPNPQDARQVQERLAIAEQTNIREKAKLNQLTGDAFAQYEARHFSAVAKANLQEVDWRVPRVNYDKDPKFNRNLLPLFQQANPGASTALMEPVPPGATRLPVASAMHFERGRTIVIEPGTAHQEANTIIGLQPLALQYPLQHPHPAGSPVVQPPSNQNVNPQLAVQTYSQIQSQKAAESDVMVGQLAQESIVQWSQKLNPLHMQPPPMETVVRPGCAFVQVHPGYRREDDVWERRLELRSLDEAMRGDVTKPMPRPVLFPSDFDNFHEGKYVKDDCPIA